MAGKSYYELLRDPQWQRKRLEVMERAEFRCESCDNASETLNVHHSYYEKGLSPWEYPAESLHCLCDTCHKLAEIVRRELHRQIGRITLLDMEDLLGYARGLEMARYPEVEYRVNNKNVASGMLAAFISCTNDFEVRADCIKCGSDVSGYDLDYVSHMVQPGEIAE